MSDENGVRVVRWKAGRDNCPPRWMTKRNPERPTRIKEYVRLAELMGLTLFDWQYDFLEVFSEMWVDPERPEHGLVPYYQRAVLLVPRQQGKTEAGGVTATHRLLMWRRQFWVPDGKGGGRWEWRRVPQSILWAAQNLTDAVDIWQTKIASRLESSGRLAEAAQLKITLGQVGYARVRAGTTGSQVRLISASDEAGHGASAGLCIVDEAWSEADSKREQALAYTQRAQPDAQYLVMSTAGHAGSLYLLGLRDVGRQRVDSGWEGQSMYAEWSAPSEDDPSLPETWRKATPSLGHFVFESRMRTEYEAAEASGTLADFRRAALNQWQSDGDHEPPIPFDVFESRVGCSPGMKGPVFAGLDGRPDRDSAVVVVSDGRWVEVVREDKGLLWVKPFLERMLNKNPDIMSVSVCMGGPLEAAGVELEADGHPVVWYRLADTKIAHGAFYDAVMGGEVSIHDRGAQTMRSALAGAVCKPSGGAWYWAKAYGGANVSSLVAASMAYYTAIKEGMGLELDDIFGGVEDGGSDDPFGDDWGLG